MAMITVNANELLAPRCGRYRLGPRRRLSFDLRRARPRSTCRRARSSSWARLEPGRHAKVNCVAADGGNLADQLGRGAAAYSVSTIASSSRRRAPTRGVEVDVVRARFHVPPPVSEQRVDCPFDSALRMPGQTLFNAAAHNLICRDDPQGPTKVTCHGASRLHYRRTFRVIIRSHALTPRGRSWHVSAHRAWRPLPSVRADYLEVPAQRRGSSGCDRRCIRDAEMRTFDQIRFIEPRHTHPLKL